LSGPFQPLPSIIKHFFAIETARHHINLFNNFAEKAVVTKKGKNVTKKIVRVHYVEKACGWVYLSASLVCQGKSKKKCVFFK
jgi:hypothetical protein